MRQNYASIANEHLRNQASRNAAIPAPTATRASTLRPARTAAPMPAPCARKASQPHGTTTFASGKRCHRCRQPPPGTCPERRKRRHARIRQIERQRASDASADRHRTLIVLRAAGRFVAIERNRSRLSRSRATCRAMRVPIALPPPRFRAGISYHRSAMTNVEGTTRFTFHRAFTNGSDTSRSRPLGIHRPRASLRFFHRKYQRRSEGEQKFLV